MTFEPNKITKGHILNAVKKIKDEDIDLIPSRKFDVIIGDQPYPPKDIMRYAHKEMNGEYIWMITGGEPTNKYLKKHGFKIISKSTNTLIVSHLDIGL